MAFLFSPHTRGRHIAVFIIVAGILTLPFSAFNTFAFLKNIEKQAKDSGVQGLVSFTEATAAVQNGEFGVATASFQDALGRFSDARNSTEDIGAFLKTFLASLPEKGEVFQDRVELLKAGEETAAAGVAMSRLVERFSVQNFSLSQPLVLLGHVQSDLASAVRFLSRAVEHFDAITLSSLPENTAYQFSEAKKLTRSLYERMVEGQQLLAFLDDVLGQHTTQRYLVVFQNNHEIRPTGGFIGSFALVDIDNGKVKHIEIPGGGPYDLRAGLRTRVIAPFPFHIMRPEWEFQDANWFPDFPSSAQKLAWFLEQSGGPSVDGVIALNARFAEQLFKLTGPINMPQYEKIITAENFFDETQRAVEVEYDKKENKPKKFVADLVAAVFDRIGSLPSQESARFAALFVQGAQERDIQVFFTSPERQRSSVYFGVDGAVKQSPKDYFMLVDANIAGGKTDAVIHPEIRHTVTAASDGSLTATIRITRRHEGKVGELFTGMTNNTYMRMYVPQGSVLVSATGFWHPSRVFFKNPPEGYSVDADLLREEKNLTRDNVTHLYVSQEFDKTVFGGWVQTKPQHTSVTELSYRLPFNLITQEKKKEYLLFVQRQSGSSASYAFSFVMPSSLKPEIVYPSSLRRNGDHFLFNAPLVADKVIALSFH